jgi:hypothetical protein
MKTYNKFVWDSRTLKLVGSEIRHQDYQGPVERFCGASSQQKSAFADEQKTAGMLRDNLAEFAGTNQGILKDLMAELTPIASAGPGQFGFSPAEETALRTSATENLAAASRNATNSYRSAMASAGGGNLHLPSGSEAAINASLAEDAASKQAAAQLGITEKGYDIGRQNWEMATQGLASAPGQLENPVTSAGNAAVGGGQVEQSGAQAITDANNAWMAPVAGLIGGVAGGLIPKIPGGGGGKTN